MWIESEKAEYKHNIVSLIGIQYKQSLHIIHLLADSPIIHLIIVLETKIENIKKLISNFYIKHPSSTQLKLSF